MSLMRDLRKQYRPRSDAAEHGFLSEFTLTLFKYGNFYKK